MWITTANSQPRVLSIVGDHHHFKYLTQIDKPKGNKTTRPEKGETL
jgi:hypothetical protein